jgi:hypothetical protein
VSEKLKQALCCECGQLRTFKRSRNHHQENYWLSGPVDRDWHRELGDLKCQNCGKVTTHALLHRDGDWAADHAEMLQRVALGGTDPRLDNEHFSHDLARVRERYRQSNFPRNPYVRHRWWKSDEDEARKAGDRWFPGMCGEMVALPETPSKGTDITEFNAPTHITDPCRADHENLDVETGLWWTSDGECVNCLRVRHNRLIAKRRELLNEWLGWLRARPERVPDEHVELLIAAFEATQPKKVDQ